MSQGAPNDRPCVACEWQESSTWSKRKEPISPAASCPSRASHIFAKKRVSNLGWRFEDPRDAIHIASTTLWTIHMEHHGT